MRNSGFILFKKSMFHYNYSNSNTQMDKGNKKAQKPHSHLVIKVAQAAVTLCGAVELCDLRDVEAVHELLPYGLAQPVAQRHAHPMLSLCVPDRLVQQVSADLANVLHNLEDKGEEREYITLIPGLYQAYNKEGI